MATPRPSHLALICVAVLHLLARATTGEHLLVHSRTNTTTTTTFPPHASILSLASNSPAAGAGWPASSHPLRGSSSPSALSGSAVFPPRHLDVSSAAREDGTAPAAPSATPPAPPCPRSCGVHTRGTALDEPRMLRPVGINTAPSKKAAATLLNALPLLAIPFLPPPLAALVALSTLATPVRACSAPSASCSGLTHATCTVYRYLHDNGTVDRAQPFAGLRTVCLHPLCDAATYKRALSTAYGHCNGRLDDPFHGYCSVEAEALSEGNSWRSMPAQLPVADPDAVAAAGGDICYVELEHMNYREDYYIRCPVCDSRHVPVLRCTEFPHDAIAAAVWTYRRLTCSDTGDWHTDDTAKTQLDDGLEDHMKNFDRLVFLIGVHTSEAALDNTRMLSPVGITAPPKKAALLNALPLLAVPFLPPPLVALVALSTLATPVRACSIPSASCSGLTHATCTVYRYLHDNGTVNRAQPFAALQAVCLHPRCDAGSEQRTLSTAYGYCRGRLDDPFHGYCSVRSLEAEVVPEGKAWRIMPVHLPVADPDAVVAAGGDVCYVELEHMNYREGYYIRCPVRDCRHVPVLCCTEFPHDAIAAAVWEHRRLTYRDAVGRYTNDTVKPQIEGLEDHDEL
ncbi:hypothetical protein BAE44_0008100 [Dichanthelium oligosanthes]|uniref:Uncharacterized protein n=1 Tax=Dichanthelium oligosanthes TaxID=888268 RepID=A0A1E5W0K7_9POAL|nr:hypothetical protein BAE44_0008100 [Dichanthelium oligosanthes]